MPIFWADYFLDTGHLSAAQHGAYLLLIARYWISGEPLEGDEDRLRHIARMTRPEWRKNRETIANFFEIRDGFWFHRRVEDELRKVAEKFEKRGKPGAVAKWGPLTASSGLQRSQRLAEARRKGKHTAQEWLDMLSICGEACLKCGSIAEKLVKDHVVPIYQGGSDAIDNLQPLCGPCNSSKGSYVEDYRPEGWQASLQALMQARAGTLQALCRQEKPGELELDSPLPPKSIAKPNGSHDPPPASPLDGDLDFRASPPAKDPPA